MDDHKISYEYVVIKLVYCNVEFHHSSILWLRWMTIVGCASKNATFGRDHEGS